MAEKFQTLHPDPNKQGTNIDQDKYEQVRDAILEAVQAAGEISFQDLVDTVTAKLESTFDGSVPWYVTTVKLDLEARHQLERAPNHTPQMLRLTN